MARSLDPKLREQLVARLDYYREMGIYDFYQRSVGSSVQVEMRNQEEIVMSPQSRISAGAPGLLASEQPAMSITDDVPTSETSRDSAVELRSIRDDLGECTRCRLHIGRKHLVFGVGNPNAELMFIGEAPGADEDLQGLPFVGRAGQLLTNMIAAMGLRREDVYIANIIKCRPPGNRTPERDECETCSPYLMRQIAAIRPKVIVALGAVAARTLLAINAPMAEFRGRWYELRPRVDSQGAPDPPAPGVKLAVTYHPAFLLRDPRQKKEAWKDLQMVMKELGLKPPTKSATPV
jgi:DNA polymerase